MEQERSDKVFAMRREIMLGASNRRSPLARKF